MDNTQVEIYTHNPVNFVMRMNELINKAYNDKDNQEEAIAGGAILFAFEYYGRRKMDEHELNRCARIFGNTYIKLHKLCKFPLSAGEP